MEVNDTLLPSLMTILEKLGCIFYNKNHNLLVHLKASRHTLKKKRKTPSKLFAPIMAENIAQKSLKATVIIKEYEEN